MPGRVAGGLAGPSKKNPAVEEASRLDVVLLRMIRRVATL